MSDTRLSYFVTSFIWALSLDHFAYDEDVRAIEPKTKARAHRKRYVAAKKEIEAIGGYFNVLPRGVHYIEIWFKIPSS